MEFNLHRPIRSNASLNILMGIMVALPSIPLLFSLAGMYLGPLTGQYAVSAAMVTAFGLPVIRFFPAFAKLFLGVMAGMHFVVGFLLRDLPVAMALALLAGGGVMAAASLLPADPKPGLVVPRLKRSHASPAILLAVMLASLSILFFAELEVQEVMYVLLAQIAGALGAAVARFPHTPLSMPVLAAVAGAHLVVGYLLRGVPGAPWVCLAAAAAVVAAMVLLPGREKPNPGPL